jgi:hypothetical protein
MEQVAIYRNSISDILTIVHELRAAGLSQDVDFKWNYSPPTWAGKMKDRHATFSFNEGRLAVWFALKWS